MDRSVEYVLQKLTMMFQEALLLTQPIANFYFDIIFGVVVLATGWGTTSQ